MACILLQPEEQIQSTDVEKECQMRVPELGEVCALGSANKFERICCLNKNLA